LSIVIRCVQPHAALHRPKQCMTVRNGYDREQSSGSVGLDSQGCLQHSYFTIGS